MKRGFLVYAKQTKIETNGTTLCNEAMKKNQLGSIVAKERVNPTKVDLLLVVSTLARLTLLVPRTWATISRSVRRMRWFSSSSAGEGGEADPPPQPRSHGFAILYQVIPWQVFYFFIFIVEQTSTLSNFLFLLSLSLTISGIEKWKAMGGRAARKRALSVHMAYHPTCKVLNPPSPQTNQLQGPTWTSAMRMVGWMGTMCLSLIFSNYA